VDLAGGDIDADLSTTTGRTNAIDGIRERAPNGLDGFIPCAGLSLVTRPLSRIAQVNYFAVVETILGLKDLVAAKRGTVLIVSSNSANMIESDDPLIQKCLSGDEAETCEYLACRDGHTAYAGSKRAILLWMRRHASAFAEFGVRMNAIAPGVTLTPMTEAAYADEEMGGTYRSFASMTPWGGKAATPLQIANVMRFLLSPEANFVCGAVLFADGGTDAKLNGDRF